MSDRFIAVLETTTNQTILKNQLQQNKEKLIKENTTVAVAEVDTKAEEVLQKEKSILTRAITFEDIKVQEVVAQIKALKETNQNVTEAEIDALLDRAEKEISLQKLYDKSEKTVDADALLQDVEADLEQSFRDRIFEALKVGYKDVKTAVAERNN